MCEGYPRIQTCPFVLVASGVAVAGNALHPAANATAVAAPAPPWSAGWPVTVFFHTLRLASKRSPGPTDVVKFPAMPINRSLKRAVLLVPSLMDEILTGPRFLAFTVNEPSGPDAV